MQAKYGAFNPRFAGIDLHFSSFDAFEAFQAIADSENTEEIKSRARELVANSRLEAFEFLSLATVVDHETRHFHDYLLCPHGSAALRIRLKAALNALGLIGELNNRFDVHPIPITRWIELQSDEIQLLNEEMNSRFAGQRLAIPDEFPRDLRDHAETVARGYKAIKNLVYNPAEARSEFAFQPWHVFEASAHLVQLQSIWSFFGKLEVRTFQDELERQPQSSRYTLLSRTLRRVNANQEPMNLQLAAIAYSWALLGDYFADKWLACPSVRFERLMRLLEAEGLPSRFEDASELMSEWSDKTGLSRVDSALDATTTRNDAFVEELQSNDEAIELSPLLVASAEKLAEASRHMSKLFLQDPTTYIWPRQYLENQANWVSSPVRIVCWPLGLIVGEEGPGNLDILVGRESSDGNTIAHSLALPTQTPGIAVFDTLQADETATELAVCDFYFAPFDRASDPIFSVIREANRSQGTFFHEILF